MAIENIRRALQRIFKHYRKHDDDIEQLFDATGCQRPPRPVQFANPFVNDFLALKAKADQSLAVLQEHFQDVDGLANSNLSEIIQQNPAMAEALVAYRKDLDLLMGCIQGLYGQAPKTKGKAVNRKVKTNKF